MGSRLQDLNLFPASSPPPPPWPSLSEVSATTVGFEVLSPQKNRIFPLSKDDDIRKQRGQYRDYVTVIVDEEDEDKRCGNGNRLCSRGHWRHDEDAKLKELVTQSGPQNWSLIAEHLDGRSGKSCRLRWFNQLDPRINKGVFTEEEEERLLEAHRLYGTQWALISKLFPGRTDNAVKNHWHVIMARKLRDRTDSTTRRRRKLLPPQTLMPAAPQKNASSESTISSNRDEGAVSTCTELSLSPSTTAAGATLLFGCHLASQMCNNVNGTFGFTENGGSPSDASGNTTNSDSDAQISDSTRGGGDSVNSDSNSASVSAPSESESVSRRDSSHGDGTGRRLPFPFIDFLVSTQLVLVMVAVVGYLGCCH